MTCVEKKKGAADPPRLEAQGLSQVQWRGQEMRKGDCGDRLATQRRRKGRVPGAVAGARQGQDTERTGCSESTWSSGWLNGQASRCGHTSGDSEP